VWLFSSGLQEGTKSLIIAAQDQALSMRYYQRNIIKQPVDNKYRMCQKAEKHIKHIIMGCIKIAPSEHSNRHNKVAGFNHWMICKYMGLQVTDKYYEHMPKRVINVNCTNIIWDILVITNQTITTN
jgi:predicted alpha/beta-fold hydrolase